MKNFLIWIITLGYTIKDKFAHLGRGALIASIFLILFYFFLDKEGATFFSAIILTSFVLWFEGFSAKYIHSKPAPMLDTITDIVSELLGGGIAIALFWL